MSQTESSSRILKPARLRQILEDQGPVFIKLGQFLAIRPDLVPKEYCQELLKLVDDAPSFDFKTARKIIETSLGKKMEHYFEWVNPRPIASASLAQVYFARSHSGDELAIKVQRENLREQIERDLRKLTAIGNSIQLSRLTSSVSTKVLLEEFKRWLYDEIDPKLELSNLKRMYQLSRGSNIVRIPKPFPQLSKGHIITMEYLRGVPFSELLRLVQDEKFRQLSDLGFDREKLAKNLVHAMLNQIFCLNFFHADTHPGNLVALPDNVVGFVDFGLTESLDESFREGLQRYISAVSKGDSHGILQGLKETLIQTESTDFEAFRRDFFDETHKWNRRRNSINNRDTSHGSSTTQYFSRILQLARKYHLEIPPSLLSMYRALLTSEAVAFQLGSKNDLLTEGEGFFSQLHIENVMRNLSPEKIQDFGLQVMNLAKDGPGQLRHLLSELSQDRFILRVRNTETLQSQRQNNMRAKLISAAMASVGIAILIAEFNGIFIKGIAVTLPLWIALILVCLWAIKLWRELS